MFGLKRGKAPPADSIDVSPSKEELRGHHLATSSASPPANGDGPHWDMSLVEDDEDQVAPSPPPVSRTSSVTSSTPSRPRATTSSSAAATKQRTATGGGVSSSTVKAQKIAASAGTSRLNRILHQPSAARVSYVPDGDGTRADENGPNNAPAYEPRRSSAIAANKSTIPPVAQPKNEAFVGKYVAQHVIPPLRVDAKGSTGGGTTLYHPNKTTRSLQQECLLSMRCKAFEITKHSERVALGALQDPSGYAKHKRKLGLVGGGLLKGGKARHKLRYIFLVRSTNRSLAKAQDKKKENGSHDGDDVVEEYEHMYQEDAANEENQNPAAADTSQEVEDAELALGDKQKQDEPEVSSFPVLVCLALHSDGTNPDVRKLISLEQLTTVQDIAADDMVQLVFQGGDSVWLNFSEFDSEDEDGKPATGSMYKEKFLWSLLQIHAMLCTSVLERNLKSKQGSLQPLHVRNLDRAELQYVAQVNGFLRDSPTLCALLDRQREIHRQDEEEAAKAEDKDLAYDILMGNYTTRLALFQTAEEKADAEDVLNAISAEMPQEQEEEEIDRLGELLQMRMRDLESETCRRLIAWEDEKHYSLLGQSAFDDSMGRDTTVDSLSLSALFQTLDLLDRELGDMEDWLEDRAAVIQPLTDDCRDIEEENRQLEQQWKSYEMLGTELRRLLQGVELERSAEKFLKNPASALIYDSSGDIDVAASERGVDRIHDAGQALKEANDNAKRAGGVHLLAVSERVEGLNVASDHFCTALAQIIVTVMEQLKTDVVAASDHGKVSKHDTHTMISKKIRDTQRKFQSALLGYMKLIEILSQLKPSLLPAIRDAYSEMVAEGILMKKRMKGYFQALPGKNSAYLTVVSHDLKEYSPYADLSGEKKVNATDIGAALGELLPVIAREAYFTAALFGLSNKTMDGREKKRNFESAKQSVDHSSQYFRYYIQRTCGILDGDVELTSGGRTNRGDPMLSLVASIYLNEAMEQYIDREKKGGDQSLSLAYVRATILGLRKKVDKQWVAWVEEQIDWIKSNPGVPATGKRAGILMSFSRFPTYLDHILMCTREGRREGYTPEFSNIQVVSYYLQKMANALLESLRLCADRESTDQEYASNVMRMENTYYFTHKIQERGPEMTELFQKQLTRASAICKQSTDQYLGWMIKREFKPLYALFSQISRVRRDVGDKDVPIHVPRMIFVKTLQKELNREVMKEKINLIYDRMEKHLSEDGGLLPIAWKALVKILYEWFGRWEKLSLQCYKHVLEPSAVDIVRLAKQVGGSSTTDPSSKPTPSTQVSRVKQKQVPDQSQFTGRRLFGK